MALEEYKAKRDFAATPEPPARPAKGHRRPIFVVQEHDASRLHYDFRLEADGVLKSWAVPKQPSLDPSVKRLAVHVEDHPLSYADFEGTIPAGHYGAGTVRIWDRGTYTLLTAKDGPQTVSEGIDAGRLAFVLHGAKLRGRFALVRMKGRGDDNWLLIKLKDQFAQAEPPAEKRPKANPKARKKATAAAVVEREEEPPDADELEFTSTDKVIYPAAGITKGEVLDYYRTIAPRLLPYLRDRPVTLERLPDGLGGRGTHFFQKNTPAHYPAWVPRVELPTEEGKLVRYAVVNDVQTLLYLVNQGTLTFHVWFSRVGSLERPDFVLFDLDPGQAAFADTVAVAQELHATLKGEGVKAFVKTSGKTGLHVLVPWSGAGGYDEARAWALAVAGRVAEALPKQATTAIRKAKRGRRVYIDVMQNVLGHHAVPPYVLRPTPAATVSTPLAWDELTADLDPAAFTLQTIFRRLQRQKRDPLAALAKSFAG
jgi:bifunctional non-homologous end joining protein LigD